ncbi:alpha-tocopherol transfer protein-like [Centruroides sculpturatus]|uniref:alpha-tocopherol transfer protein-like n=1 Tax=Centruroides sculpturatus TaxID=218467 RepID=UPI000C6EC16D|nr:alpha-tocopherol transfer protein-like [Centruroides sculpturatus]
MQEMNIVQSKGVNTSIEYSWNEKELEEFRNMVLREKNLNSRTDDLFLLSFLRSRKYDKSDALKLLKNYYSVRRSVNELKNLRPSAIEHVLQSNVMAHLYVEGGMGLGFGRASHWDTSKISAIDLGRGILMHIDFNLNDHRLQVNGVSVIVDIKTLSWKHVICFSPKIVRYLISWFYNALPVSYKSIHFIHVNSFFFAIISVVFPFLPKKLKERIRFHGSNLDSLFKEIDSMYIPVELGGKLNIDWSESNQLIRDNEEFFIENEKYWNNEKES